MPKNNIKCYIYTRVSTAIQVDGYSLDAQKDKLRKYADYQNMEIAGEYSDEGASGKNIAERPEFMRMMSDIEDSKDGISYVLVFKLSRFGRNAADVLSSLQRMQDHDVNLICVEDGIDSSKDAGKLMISVLSAVAEIERENIRAQTMAGREQKAREGRWNGGFAPYGYKLVDGELQIAEDEVDIIRIIFDQYVNKGKGTIAIARYLNDQGYVKKLRQNNSINGFSEVFVRKVLANPVYAGKIAYGRRRTEKKPGTHNEMHIVAQEEYPVYEGKHEAIISEDVWKMAEERRKKKAAMRAPKTNCRVAIISGILKCPCCGKGMYSNTSKPHSKDNKERHYYYCKNNSNATGHRCEFRQNIENSKLEKEVVYVITNLVRNPVFVDAIKAKIGESIDTTELEKKLKTLEGKLRQAEAIKNRLEKQMDELPYDDAMFERKMSDLQRRYDKQYDTMQEVENDIEEVKMQLMSIRQNQLTEENIYNVLLAFDDLYDTFDPMEKKQFFKSFIERIEIYPQKREDGTYLKKLVFNFPIPSFNGGTGKEISLEYSDTLETVVLLSKLSSAPKLEVKISMSDLDLTEAEAKATYDEIQDYVKQQTGLHVTHLNIAQIKRKHGIIERANYNLPKSENSRHLEDLKKILETERLFLREMSMDDFDALYKVLADKEIMQHYPYIFDEERVRGWIERNINRYKDNGFGLWAVCLKDTGEMIGDCGLTLQNIEGEMLPEIGYHIRRDMQRKGYAKEAAIAVRDWAFANTEYPAIYSYCKYTNEGSFKTAESIGMHFCKEYPDEANGITHVSVIRREDL